MRVLVAVAAVTLTGCGDLVGFGGEVTPLVRIHAQTTGSAPEPIHHLRIGLMWAEQSLPEAFCILPAESPEAAAVIAKGCSDPLRFVAARMQVSVDAAPDEEVELALYTLPTADLLVGDVSARVAYASIIAFDDRDDSGTLEVFDVDHEDPELYLFGDPVPTGADVVLGASFVSMAQPDQRIAFREGAFVQTGFYPRAGCPEPPPFFSVLGAGGFSFADAVAASLAGELPQEDPATCATTSIADAVVGVSIADPTAASQTRCRGTGGGTRYHEAAPELEAIALDSLTWACAKLPSFTPPDPNDVVANQWQLVIASPADDPCINTFHIVLHGCDYDPMCGEPEWDWLAVPPNWWPCPRARLNNPREARASGARWIGAHARKRSEARVETRAE